MSQQAFAEIFDLKRGTLGAYEEGRSEPKIETIIKIANHFSIPIGDILTKELTVNQLLKFRGDLQTQELEEHQEIFMKIPCITPNNKTDYLKYADNPNFIQDLPGLSLPIHNEVELRAYIIDNLEMSTDQDGLYPKDVIIGERISKRKFNELQSSCLFLTVLDDQILLRRLFQANKNFVLKADHRGIDDLEIKHSEVRELWEVKYVFFHRALDLQKNEVQNKLAYLEEEFKKLKSSL